MNFSEFKAAAETWVRSGQGDFELVAGLEDERQLVFSSPSAQAGAQAAPVSFYVICPNPAEKSQRWHVWSDSDLVLAHLNEVQQFLNSCKPKTLQEILNQVTRCLRPVLHAHGASDDDDDIDAGYEEDGTIDDDDDDDPDYYQDEDLDAAEELPVAPRSLSEAKETADSFFTGDGSSTAVHRLLADLKSLRKSEGKFGVTGQPKDDNLFIWGVKLTDFPKDTLLGKDLHTYAKKCNKEAAVHLEMKFPKDYPMAPPFVRVVKPRFRFLTGHITLGGSICMEVLTRSGWRPSNDIEGILVQIRAEIMSDTKAQLDMSNPDRSYDEAEARAAFERMVKRYGWDK